MDNLTKEESTIYYICGVGIIIYFIFIVYSFYMVNPETVFERILSVFLIY